MTVAEKHRELIEAFSLIPDRQERLAAIVERARRSPPLPASEKTAVNRVPGCISPVWLSAKEAGGHLTYRADADAAVVKGLVRLLCELYEGATPADIVTSEPTIFEDLDLIRDLSPTRRHGLSAVRTRIKAIATQHLSSP